MVLRLARRLVAQSGLRLSWKLCWNLLYKGTRSIRRHKRRLRRGKFFPPFLLISVTHDAGSRAPGGAPGPDAHQQMLDPAALDRLIVEAKAVGNRVFGILGGEPLLHPRLLDVLAGHRDCYFLIRSSGQALSVEVAQRLRKLGHVSPLITIDQADQVGDAATKGGGTARKSLAGLQNSLDQRLVTGVAVRLSPANFAALVSPAWIDRLVAAGVLYLWYQVEAPASPEPTARPALTPAQLRQLRAHVVEMRADRPLVVTLTHYDQRGRSLCPAVAGITYHISPWGDIEPCPLVRFAKESIHTPGPLRDKFEQSDFLGDFRRAAAGATRGCILWERPDLLRAVIAKHSARDTTPGQTATDAVWSMSPGPPQDDGKQPIREQSWLYRIAGRLWFNDFGVYQHPERLVKPKGAKGAKK